MFFGLSLLAGCGGGAATGEVGENLVADDPPTLYHVTLTNTTGYQGFSFPVAATHARSAHLFQNGAPASAQVAACSRCWA